MNDLLPGDSPAWQHVEGTLKRVLQAYGYGEIRFPVLEHTELFKRSIGEVTDIVEKEMYTFEDRNGDSLTLRPEGTACCVRACEEHGLLYNQTQRLWYMGPMFRHERPQKGRYRQFSQLGVETFGFAGPDIDAELLLLAARIFRELGISHLVSLQLNSLGDNASRARYKAALVDYLSGHRDALDEDSRRRLETNPLRILDSKSPQTQALLDGAPVLTDYLDEESRAHFEELQALLVVNEVPFELNPRLVRGLDYYGRTAFEWVTDQLGAQSAVCAGGRYDALVEQLGGRPTPAIGFGIGLDRLVLLVQAADCLPPAEQFAPHIYLVVSDGTGHRALQLAEELRSAVPGLRLVSHCGGGSLKSQMKKADRSGARVALILGETELAAGALTVKHLRADGGQETLPRDQAVNYFSQMIASDAV